MTDLVTRLGHSSAAIQKAHLPENLQFLKDGYTSTLGHDDLTAPGRLQLFEHGVECVFSCRGKYIDGSMLMSYVPSLANKRQLSPEVPSFAGGRRPRGLPGPCH